MLRSHCLLAALALLAPMAAAQNDTLAVQKGSTLTITGGDGVDDFQLSNTIQLADGDGPPDGVLVGILPRNGTTVNGGLDVVNFTGVKKLNIDLGDGDDVIDIASFGFEFFPLTLHAGDGDDDIGFLETTIGPVKLFGDDGNDLFELDSTTFGDARIVGGDGTLTVDFDSVLTGDLSITGGPEADSLLWTGATIEGLLKVSLLQGDDSVEINDIDGNKDAKFTLSSGNNSFKDTDSHWDFGVSVTGGPDDDVVNIKESQIGESLKLRLAAGSNQLIMTSVAQGLHVGEDLNYAGGPDTDLITITASDMGSLVQIGAHTRLKSSAGDNDCFLIGTIEFGEDLRYAGGPDTDTLDLNGGTVGTDAILALSSGTNDATLFEAHVHGDLKVSGGAGDDTISVDPTTQIEGTQSYKLGGGSNTSP